jgi:hypothetical protein
MFNYFIHPSCLSAMDNVLKMRMSEGAAGFGIYVMILEQLRNSETYSLKYDAAVLAWSLHESDVALVQRVIQDYQLFQLSADGVLSSPWLSAIMAKHEQRRAKLSAAGKKSAATRATTLQPPLNKVEEKPQPPLNKVEEKPQPPLNKVEEKPQQINKEKKEKNKKNTIQPLLEGLAGVNVFDKDFISKVGKESGAIFDPIEHAPSLENDSEHNRDFLYALAITYRMTVRQLAVLYVATDGGLIGSDRLIALIAVVKHCRETNFKPSFPFEYFMSKLKNIA